VDWIQLDHDRVQWRTPLKAVAHELSGFMKGGGFLTCWAI